MGLVSNILLGTIYSWSVFRKPLENLLGWTSFESGVPFSVFLLFFAASMPLSGKLLRMYGPRRVAFLGGLLVGLGWILAGFSLATTYPLLLIIVFYGVVAGSGVAMVYNTTITVASNWVPERRGLAVGLTLVGFGISPLITAPLANYLIFSQGVQGTFLTIGLMYGAILLALSAFMVLPRIEAQVGRFGTAASPSPYGEYSPSMMVKTARFAGLWIAYAFGTLGGFVAIGQAAKYGQEVVGLSPELAAMATGVFALFNGAGRPLFGYLADRLQIYVVSIISFVLGIGAALLAAQISGLAAYMVSYSVFWLVFGGWLALAPRATTTFFGVQNLSVNYGIVFTAYGASALVGPTLASILYESLRQYSPVYLLVASLYGLGLIISITMLRTPPEQRKEVSAMAK